MIIFIELREIFEIYNPSLEFLIFSILNRLALISAVGYKAVIKNKKLTLK